MNAWKDLSRWAPAVAWMAVIFAFSHHANIETGLSCDFTVKKAAHTLEYALLALALNHALGGRWGAFGPWAARKAWALSTLYAVTDEFHQWFIPTRTATPRDVVIDSLGAAVGLALLHWATRRRAKAAPKTETDP